MKSLIFKKTDGTEYKLKDLGIRVVEFEPESLNVINEVVNIPGSTAISIPVGYEARYINAEFAIHALNLVDYALFRSELFELFVRDEPFYIIDEKDMTKRWYVRSDGMFSLSRALKTGKFTISFLCVNSYQESVNTSLYFSGKKYWSDEKFAWNGMITWDDELNYTFNTNSFSVNNLGNAKVIPESSQLKITIKTVANGYFEMRNNTNGSIFRYRNPLNSSDTLVIDGVRVLKNGQNSLINTDMSFISLEPGINDIVVTSGSLYSASFDFRFLFK